MAIIPWSEALEVGIASIDAEHRALVELINKLHAALMQGRGRVALAGAFKRILSYAGTHFANEEALMDAHAYPLVEAHKAEHAALVAEAEALRARFEQSGSMVGIAVLFFLKRWLTEHILASDRRLAQHLRGQGVL